MKNPYEETLAHTIGFKPYMVVFTRIGATEATPYLTTTVGTLDAARKVAADLCPESHTAAVYKLTAEKLDDPKPDHHQRAAQLARNGRWGTCSGCPEDHNGVIYPERCQFTDRYDHNLGPEKT